ncbi:hypothetical protein ONS95_009002 [Cadophora gregata]|uniref:uncharacterized protein n=1 Tax=Cadophora gregata TaxID=51156 RepID=UPI0026DB2ABB|nr:uncharacterized protein ONS95_009002 [Cadophora gregata]KAK0124015.1 hypothetical protein ONS95_009002 [Cadophora gregata]KAK0130351.1 hypothetical protein ONS96_000873 [Cadophora gregata f. sp. sojae]
MSAIIEAELPQSMASLTLVDAPNSTIRTADSCDLDRKKLIASEDSTTKTKIHLSEIQLDCRVLVISKLQHFCRFFDIYADDNDENAGQARTSYIDRLNLKVLQPRNFHGSLERLSSQSNGHTFALDLCNRDGTLQSRHMMHPWGKEINHGAILILSLFIVEEGYRRQGIAQTLLQAQIAKAEKQKRGLRFMFVKPGVVPDDVERQLYGRTSLEESRIVKRRAYANAVRFYRTFGFRRVGLTNWFCFAMDPEHPSHNVALDDDPDPVPNTKKEIHELERLMNMH